MIARSLWAGLLLVALAGCNKYMDFYSCLHPDRGHRDANNNPDPCHENDPEPGENAHAEPRCDVGEFAHWSYLWESPTLLWIGPEDQAPGCPRGPTTISYEGHTDLVAPATCEVCTCEPPTGSCTLSSTITASTVGCNIPGGATASFNAPIPWDGSCDGTIQVPGGSAHSVAVEPITIADDVCAAGPTIPAKVISLSWDTVALGCDVDLPKGPVDRSICLPDDLLEQGFALCIFRDGEHDCPKEPGTVFTERHVFYQGVQDDRLCSTCSCGPPTGSLCKGQLSLYEGNDLTCSGTTFAQIPLSSAQPSCLDIGLPGQALGGKSAAATTYIPGTCSPMGGDASGSAIPTEPSTLCCRP